MAEEIDLEYRDKPMQERSRLELIRLVADQFARLELSKRFLDQLNAGELSEGKKEFFENLIRDNTQKAVLAVEFMSQAFTFAWYNADCDDMNGKQLQFYLKSLGLKE
jgi:hypothetical protein